MSTLLVENIRHEDATNPALVLDANGNLGVNLIGGNVGVGENTPEEKLHIKTTSKYAMEIQRNSFSDNAENLIRFSNSGTPSVYSTYIGSIRTSGGSGIGDIVLGTAPSIDPGVDSIEERLRITHNGRFGVRTPSPNTTFHVKSNGTGNSYGSFYLEIDEATNYPAMVIQTATGGNYTETHGLYIKNTAAGYGLRIDDTSNDTSPFVVDTEGRVGVGTTTPQEKLEVNGVLQIRRDSDHPALRFAEINSGTTTTRGYIASGDWAVNGGAIDDFGISGSVTGDLLLATNAGTERLRIQNATGNVGIGTSEPLARLHVNHTTNAITGASVDVSGIGVKIHNPVNDTGEAVGIGFGLSDIKTNVGAAIIHNREFPESVGGLHFATKSDQTQAGDIPIRMTISRNGDVGIGTTTPVSKLDVNGHVASEQMWTHVYTSKSAGSTIPLYEKDGTTLLNSFSGLIMVKDSHRDPTGMVVHVVSGPELAYNSGIFQTYNEISYKNADGDSQRKYQMTMNGTRAEIQIVGSTSHGSWNGGSHTIAVTYMGAGL